MTGRVSEIWRHPIKSHGREPLEAVTLEAGKVLPWDGAWAVAHERSTADGSDWASCGHFCRVAKIPALMAITSSLDEKTGHLTLRHPDRTDLTFDPKTEGDTFIDWVKPLVPEDALQPARLVEATKQGFSDSDFRVLPFAIWHRIAQSNNGSGGAFRICAGVAISGLTGWHRGKNSTGTTAKCA